MLIKKDTMKIFLISKRLFLSAVLTVPFMLGAQTYINFNVNQPQPLQADAGPDTVICTDDTLDMGGLPAAQFGTPPYSYSWSPATFLSDAGIANPMLSGASVGNYQYVLTVSDSLNCLYSDTMNLVVDPCPGMNESDLPFHLAVYPNPSDGLFKIQLLGDGPGSADLNVINNLGQIVFHSSWYAVTSNTFKLDLSDFPKGIYVISLQSAKTEIKKTITLY